jgi:Zn finger protein HypA/HybF involved in hydrogenase expression
MMTTLEAVSHFTGEASKIRKIFALVRCDCGKEFHYPWYTSVVVCPRCRQQVTSLTMSKLFTVDGEKVPESTGMPVIPALENTHLTSTT